MTSDEGMMSSEARIPCPHCAEQILPAATVCRFCGRSVTPGQRSPDGPTNNLTASRQAVSAGVLRAAAIIIAILLAVGFALSVFVKIQSMGDVYDGCQETFDHRDTSNWDSTEYLDYSIELGQCAVLLRQENKGIRAHVSGLQDKLEELAGQMKQEADRLAELSGTLAAQGS